MVIFDSGVHIWLPQAPDRPWTAGRSAHLPEPLTYQRLLGMMDHAGVDRAILVPPSWEGERIDYSLALQLPFLKVSESMDDHDSAIVGAVSVD